ncbi:MAG TPA: hypothetical protein VJ300_03065 [Thermoplasmata archaeon]|nr:hypothetical protein [Thermoplasmata archaeon]
MTYLKTLGERLEDASTAGGKFADALIRAAGTLVSGALEFADRELESATKPRGPRNEGSGTTPIKKGR